MIRFPWSLHKVPFLKGFLKIQRYNGCSYCATRRKSTDDLHSKCIPISRCMPVQATVRSYKRTVCIGGGGGGYSLFFFIFRLGPSTVVPQKISGKSSAPNKILKFLQPPKISTFCTFTLRKDPKIHRYDP